MAERLIDANNTDFMQEISTSADVFICMRRFLEQAPTVPVPKWINVNERMPEDFVSVIGHMTDADPFPSVRECYKVGDVFIFPALSEIHPVDYWMPMPSPPCSERMVRNE